LFSSSQFAMVWLAGKVRVVRGRGPCHHGWCAFKSPIRRQSAGNVSIGRRAATGSGRPGE